MTIREARATEADEVLAVWLAAGSPPSVTDSAAHVRAVVASEHAWLLVAEDDGRIAGTLIAAWDGWRGHFYRLAVLPELRRRGIAAALVRAGEERLHGAGARRLAAIVLDRDDARGFWTAAGYEHQAGAGRFTEDERALTSRTFAATPARRHAVPLDVRRLPARHAVGPRVPGQVRSRCPREPAGDAAAELDIERELAPSVRREPIEATAPRYETGALAERYPGSPTASRSGAPSGGASMPWPIAGIFASISAAARTRPTMANPRRR